MPYFSQNTIPPAVRTAALEAQPVDFDQDTQKASRSTQPTIRDVAEAAGVSYGTVSKSLNGTGQLRAETRALVRSTAERLGFRPNSLAQSLLRRRSFTVGLISTDRYGRFSIPVLEGIEDALGSANISVFLCSAADDPERERQHVESLLAKRVDGIIVTARRADPRPPLHLAHVGPPVLYAFARVNDPKAQCLLPDDFGGGKLVRRSSRRRRAHAHRAHHRAEGFRGGHPSTRRVTAGNRGELQAFPGVRIG